VIFHPTELPGVVVVELERRDDERGFFARFFCRREFAEHGLELEVAQANLAFNRRAGILRGLHYQAPPHEESKLVRCVRGALYDVVVDLRSDSPTFGRWLALELTGENRRLLYIPAGVAHGYQTLVHETEAMYLHSAFHAPEAERGVRWDDPAFGIEWPEVDERVISARDRAWPDFQAN
jgi:dTDP-4-dehydrorhamnose 3,5-epimerase